MLAIGPIQLHGSDDAILSEGCVRARRNRKAGRRMAGDSTSTRGPGDEHHVEYNARRCRLAGAHACYRDGAV